MIFQWKKVYSERVDRGVRLVVEYDPVTREYVGSVVGRSWSSGSGRWFKTERGALDDARARFQQTKARGLL